MSFWSGSSALPGRQHGGRRQSISAMVRPAVLWRVLSWPQPLTASSPQGASAARQTRQGGPRARPPGTRASPPAVSVTMRCLRPALSMTRRWPRTGSACRPATRSRNAGSPRCSDAHPAAGREPESPRHGKHPRSGTRRAPRSRLNRTPWRHLGAPTRRHNPPFNTGPVTSREHRPREVHQPRHLHKGLSGAYSSMLVRADLQSPLQAQRRHPVLGRGEQPAHSEPRRQRYPRPAGNRACRHRGAPMMAAPSCCPGNTGHLPIRWPAAG